MFGDLFYWVVADKHADVVVRARRSADLKGASFFIVNHIYSICTFIYHEHNMSYSLIVILLKQMSHFTTQRDVMTTHVTS